MKIKQIATIATLAVAASIPGKAMACAADPFLGSICQGGWNFAPRGFALANGQLLPISQNSALFSLFGTIYGGDGRTTFALPDLRGRSMIHWGTGPGLSPVTIGQRGGGETMTLTQANMPTHSHSASTTVTNVVDTTDSEVIIRASSGIGNTNVPTGASLADTRRDRVYSSVAPDVDMSPDAALLTLSIGVDSSATTTVGNAGGNSSFNIRSPYLAVTHVIATVGIFPSRN